jgi:ligand-binding sensor domain-containing protein
MVRSSSLAPAVASLVLAAASLSALDPATPLSQFGHDVWTSDSGLPQNSVTAILQDRDGYLWMGTQEGLVRFDGVRFTVFDTRNTKALSDDWVQALLQARDGTLWIGTVAGLVSLKDGAFSPRFPDRLSHAAVEALFEGRDGSVWVGSELGASRIVDDRITTFSRPDGIPGPRVRAASCPSCPTERGTCGRALSMGSPAWRAPARASSGRPRVFPEVRSRR